MTPRTVSLAGRFFRINTTDETDVEEREFQLLRPIGSGGQARVYLAESRGERFVIKEPHPDLAAWTDRATTHVLRFKRELRNHAKCRHPSLIELHGALNAAGRWYAVMEFFDGITIREWLLEIGLLDETRTLEVGIEIARGLAAMHRAGIVHRDLSESNVLVRQGPNSTSIKIIDFGIAKSRSTTDAISMVDEFVGTLRYSPPERILGQSSVDETIDIYAVGALLYHLLTGRYAFSQQDKMGLMGALARYGLGNQGVESPKDLVPGISPETSATVLRAMAGRPEHRYQSSEELLAALFDCRLRLFEKRIATRE
ncbi:MAG: serine/threonine protein kinase [Planctomycetes bacterium]|nr:serine/threonine protein kinase [Planctomycetota bacterium]